jgi:hypothetical protein
LIANAIISAGQFLSCPHSVATVPDPQTTLTLLGLLLTLLFGIFAYAVTSKLIKACLWLGVAAIAILALCAYFWSWTARFIKLDPAPSPTPPPTITPGINEGASSATPEFPSGRSPVPNKTPERMAGSGPPAPSLTETPLKKRTATTASQDFDLGNIVATADWARLTQDRLEVSFRFTNKTQRPLWIIPATRREKAGIQASDDVKNLYQLRSTIGFRRGTDRLQKSLANPNDFLELRPNVPAPASFIFTRPKTSSDGATQIYFFATLSVVEDLRTFRSDNRTVSVTLNLE